MASKAVKTNPYAKIESLLADILKELKLKSTQPEQTKEYISLEQGSSQLPWHAQTMPFPKPEKRKSVMSSETPLAAPPPVTAEALTCGVPSGTIGPCDLPKGHTGMMHANGGDGFYANKHTG